MKTIIIILTILTSSITSFGFYLPDEYQQVINLKGEWKFMIGDRPQWADEKFNDSGWESIFVPSPWENQGFPGYDGYAWYRKEVFIPDDLNGKTLMLVLGYIDDVDEVYLNGVKIGQKGGFPPRYWTAYNAERIYPIPSALIKPNQNNYLAVRVYDSQLDGGIVRGSVGIYIDRNQIPSDLNLEGYWKFEPGDNKAWANPGFDDSGWGKIMVPGTWEDQISKNLDGFGWYRKKFNVDGDKVPKRYVLMMGRIDDLDEVYLNGKLVGSTGKIYDSPYKIHADREFSQYRYYYLNEGDIYTNKVNTLAVRVYDKGGFGGIYSGPVGIVELNKFITYWRNNKR